MKKITKILKKIQAIKGLSASLDMASEEASVEVKEIEYRAPSLNLLKEYKNAGTTVKLPPIELEERISEFGFESCVEEVLTGPVISQYRIKLARGVRLSQIRNVSDDLALALMSDTIRIQAPIPGTNRVGIEIANESQAIIGLKDVLLDYDGEHSLPVALGTDTLGNPKMLDLAKMPHLLIAGQTGSGKSVFINSIILSLLYTRTPNDLELVLIDPKRVEMTAYKDIPHLRCPVVTEPEDAVGVFSELVEEMDRRYRILSDARVRNIKSFNSSREGNHRMPYIVCVVDEMADLMMQSGKELEKMIVRLAQLARAVGIHLVLATQKPVVKVITGLIKSNMPTRISFQVASKMDSRVILDTNGAEKLIGRGDMLMSSNSGDPERFHGAWVSDEEILEITDSIKGA